jgi:hypothetical protein
MPPIIVCPARRLERRRMKQTRHQTVAVVEADHRNARFLGAILEFKLGKHPVLHSRHAINDDGRDGRRIDAAIASQADAEKPAGLALPPVDGADAFGSPRRSPPRSSAFRRQEACSIFEPAGRKDAAANCRRAFVFFFPRLRHARLHVKDVARSKHYRRGESSSAGSLAIASLAFASAG